MTMNHSQTTMPTVNRKHPKASIKALVLIALALPALMFTASCTKKVDDKDTTMNIVLRANVKGLDPIQANDLYSSTVIQQVYEGLLEYQFLKRPYTLQPALADGMPTVSADGLTVTIKIKKGVHFHDNAAFPGGKGREVVADDFIYSWRRLADPKNTSEGFWIFDGKVKGLNAWAEALKTGKADYKTPIEGLSTPDANTLVIKLTQPYYQLNYVLAMAFSTVVPHEAVEKYGAEFLNNPVGTGPFMLVKASDWVRNSKITLKRNPNYRPELYPSEGEPADQAAGLLADAGKQVPFADAMVFTELLEDQPRWQNLVKGNFEFAEIPNDNFDSAIKDDNTAPDLAKKGMFLQKSTAVEVTYNALNMKDPLLGKNKDLRHALSLAIDTPSEIAKFRNGRAIAAQSPLPPGLEGYDEKYKNEWVQFNIAKAKELLAKAGYPEGKGLPEFSYDTLSDSKARQIAEFQAANWAAIGVKVKITANTWPQFQEKVKNGQVQIFGIAWGADYPDAQNFLQLFYSKNVSPGPNDTSYSSPEFDKLYEKALTLPAGAERTALYQQMRDIVVEDCPWIFSMTRTNYYLANGWLKNFKINEISNDFYKYFRIDPKQRAELKPKL